MKENFVYLFFSNNKAVNKPLTVIVEGTSFKLYKNSFGDDIDGISVAADDNDDEGINVLHMKLKSIV